MKYQLVLQWLSSPTATYDALIEVEDLLVDGLAGVGDVDGHDLGSGEMNIFIWTDDAIEAFARTQTAAGQHALWKDVRAAFRDADGEVYTVIGPRDLQAFEIT